jgi:hypothetical protein
MFRRSGYRFADKNMRQSRISRACSDSEGTEQALASATKQPSQLTLERNLLLKLCISEPALARMRSYEEANVTSPSRSIVVDQGA